MAERLTFDVGERTSSALAYHAATGTRGDATLVLAHGAGAPQQSAFMVDFAKGLASRGLDVLTFNFLYTEQRRRVPDRTEALDACYRAAVGAARRHFARDRVFIGGKSMGGRIATHLAASEDADALGIAGVVLLGYPLHPPGKPDQPRTAHLPRIRTPLLIVQGERDPFGTPGELRTVIATLNTEVTLRAVPSGDHSLAPSRRADAVAAVYSQLQDEIAAWIAGSGRLGGPLPPG